MTSNYNILLLFCAVHSVYAAPVGEGLEDIPHQMGFLPGYAVFLISAVAILLLGYAIIGCVCCPNHNIKALSYQNGFPASRLNENSLQFENASEFAIFPPRSAVIDLQPVGLSYPTFEDKVTFEPLPDILPRKMSGQSAACSSRPAHFRTLLKNKVSLHDWFDDPNSNFPRDQLQYIQELGSGWFGRIVEGEASHIKNSEEKTAVFVKILHEEASPSEHLHFLHEVRLYRDLSHPNVIALLGRCLESDPFLLIMEHSISDLKTFLVHHENKDNFIKNGMPLQMACNISAGLRCLHENGFTHMDFAAHNCFVSKDFTIKVGDYGISFDKCREDYYCLGGIALPIRWCSPETLLCTDATIETKEISKEANVWAFGIILWEIFELGKLPYEELTNEEVLQKVLIEKTLQLSAPSQEFPLKEELYLIMKECWKPSHMRPTMEKIENFLTRLYNDRHNLQSLGPSFEERWNSLQPKIIDTKLLESELLPLKFENDFSDKSDSHNYSSEGERFSSFEMSYDMCSKSVGGHLSPSLRVLNGSIDELTENDICLNSVSLSCEKSLTDAVSVDSDVIQLEDDQGKQIKDIVNEQELTLSNIKQDLSRQSQKFQLHGRMQSNPFISEDCTEMSKNSDVKVGNCVGKTLPNLNVVKALDDNSNELEFNSENYYITGANKSDECESLSIENSPDSVNMKGISEFCGEKNEVLKKSFDVIAAPEAFSDGRIRVNSSEQVNDGLSFVPDIIIHESASLIEIFPDENENLIQDCKNQLSYSESIRPLRFIFKDESIPSVDKNTVKSSKDMSVTQDIPATMDSSNVKSPDDLKLGSKHLTSTPINSDHNINLNYSNSFTNNSASGSVFYDNFQDIENSSPYTEEYFSGNCVNFECTLAPQFTNPNNIENKNSNKNFNCVATSNTNGNSFDVKETSSSIEFASALSSFNETNDENVSKMTEFDYGGKVSKNSSTVSIPDNSTEITNIPTFNSEINDQSCLKCQDTQEIYSSQKPSSSPEKNNLYKSNHINFENGDYVEPVTPEVSLNVSSCSYGNDFISMSTDSPDVSSTNKDLDYYSPIKKYDPNMLCEAGLPTTPGYLRDVEYHKHADLLDSAATQDFRTLDSEASGSEYLESFSPDLTPDSFVHSDENRIESVDNMRPVKSNVKSNFQSKSTMNKADLLYDEEDLENDSESDTNAYKSKSDLCLRPYDEVIVEDLETGEQTIITESFSACDDYDNSADSDEILKINIETDEAIIVDSSEALIGFVPSRSIELLQECEIIPTLNHSFTVEDEKESEDLNHFDTSNSITFSPDSMQLANSPSESPESTYPFQQPYRNFSLQNEIIEEEITDEITTPSSIHSTASFSSNEVFVGEEKMSQSSESFNQDICETSVLPSVDHFYDESNDSSSNSDCSPVHCEDGMVKNFQYMKDYESNHVSKELQDVMYSKQPTQAVCWHSDERLDMERESPVILEGREILAGGILETHGVSVKDITATLNQLDAEDALNCQALNLLSISHSPSPYSSLESSPCRDAYTPDFESDSDDAGTSCSSTSGSFECIHNKFKDTVDISKAADESQPSDSSREQSPKKIFSKTWNCHATPSKSVLITPEKKFNSLKKSVSFHEEDPQMVFEYPPASDSSEDDHVQQEITSRGNTYNIFADWELHAPENEEPEIDEMLEIEELDSEPYVRRPSYGIGASLGPMNRPMYSFTSGFSDDDMDLPEPLAMPSKSVVPSNSPEEGKYPSLSGDKISELIKNQLNNLALEESRLKWMQDELDQQSHEFSFINFDPEGFPTSVHTSEENHDPIPEQDLLVNKHLLENGTFGREVTKSELTNHKTLEQISSAEEHADENFVSLNVKKGNGLTNKLNDIDMKIKEPVENDMVNYKVVTNSNASEHEKGEMQTTNFLIDLDTENSYSPPTYFPSMSPNHKYMAENDRFSALETDSLNTYPSNLIGFELSNNTQNLCFDSLPQKMNASTSDNHVPDKNAYDDNIDRKEQHNLPETAALTFVEGNVKANSAENNLNSNEDIYLGSLQNDSSNRPLLSQISHVSHAFFDKDLDSSQIKNISCSNLKNYIDNEIKESGSLGEEDSKTEVKLDAEKSSRSADNRVSDSDVPGQMQIIYLDPEIDEGTAQSNVKDCELKENLSNSDKIQKEIEKGTTQVSSISSDNCISLAGNTNEKHINVAARSSSNKMDYSIPIKDLNCVERSLSEMEVFTEIISNELPFEELNVKEKTGNVTSSELEMGNVILIGSIDKEISENLEKNVDKISTCPDILTSKGVHETSNDISPNCVEGQYSSSLSSNPENKINITDSKHVEIVKSDTFNENDPSKDKSLSEKENMHNNKTNLPADLGNETTLKCADLAKIMEMPDKVTKMTKELHEPLPQIIVTPASESEVEDELEEYLRDQLEFFHGPSVAEGENFSVTSQFSVQPFEDVFGSSHNSGDYIEAFNFEFHSGDFFEDFIDDYPTEIGSNRRLPLDNGNYQWWESPEVPPMIEKSSEEDDSTSTPETSPVYYSSKDATHL